MPARWQPWGRASTYSWALVVILAGLLFLGQPAAAQIGSYRYSSVVMETGSGRILSAVNADESRYPASLAKVMTLYMVFEGLRDRRIGMGQTVPVSLHASSMEPTKLGLIPGTRITVEQAVLGLITKSANDAAAALAELLGGTEDRFAQMMTLRARALGMGRTSYANASGLPDENQVTTARDQAILARRLIADFPDYYRYFSAPSFVWHGKTMLNHHHLLRSYPGADGLKTGYTHASGYNLITSAVRGGQRIVGVVLGAASGGERDLHMAGLLNAGFDRLDIPAEHRPVQAGRRGPLIAVASAARPAPVVEPPAPARARRAVLAWGIQVGSFRDEHQARRAAAAGRHAVDSGEARVEATVVKRKRFWRAQVVGLSQSDAGSACKTLAKRKAPCMVLAPQSSGEYARQ